MGGVLAASLQTAGRCRLSVVARGTGSPWAAKLPLSPLPPSMFVLYGESESIMGYTGTHEHVRLDRLPPGARRARLASEGLTVRLHEGQIVHCRPG